MLEALIFDVDGTLAETEDVHRTAFNAAFLAAGLGWQWDRQLYQRLLDVTGGKERIRHYLDDHLDPGNPPPAGVPGSEPERSAWIAALHADKTARYNSQVEAGELGLRPGVEALVRHARSEGLRLAIATTTSLPNVESLIRSTLGERGLGFFEVIAAGDMVAAKKPAPDVYRLALERLDLAPGACLALEDSENGVAAARAAHLPVVVTTSIYTAAQNFPDVAACVPDLEHLAGDARRTPVAGAAILRGLRQIHASPRFA